MNKNIMLPIIIMIVFVALVAFAGYFAFKNLSLQPEVSPTPAVSSLPTPTPTPVDTTENWQTYSNNNYGLSIKYPNNFKISPKLYPKSFTTFILNSENYSPGQNSIPTYIIHIDKISNHLTASQLQNFLVNYVVFDASGAHPKSFSEFTPITIGNNNFYFIKTGLFEGQLSLSYFLANSKGVFSFNLISTKVDWTNPNLDIQQEQGHLYLKQMLSTLNFLQ